MITMQVSVEVPDDRRVTLTLPPEVPTGNTELVVTISSKPEERKPAALQPRQVGGRERRTPWEPNPFGCGGKLHRSELLTVTPRCVFLDTSFLIALANKDDPQHVAGKEAR